MATVSSEIVEIVDNDQLEDEIPLSELTKQLKKSNAVELRTIHKKSDSEIWKYFGCLFKDNKIVRRFQDRILCKICYTNDTYIKSYSKSTSPTNLREHLSHKHKMELDVTKTVEKRQRTLNDVFCKVVKKKVDPKDNDFIFARKLTLWFCKDLLPFLTVCGIGFEDFWKSLNLKIKLPDESTLRRCALDDLYKCLKEQLLQKIGNISDHGTIGIDSWTDNYRRIAYNTATYHYVDNFQTKSFVLKTSPFPPPHNAKTYKKYFDDLIVEYKLQNKKLNIITDGANTMKAFAAKTTSKRFGCLAHSVNRLIQHDLMKSEDVDMISLIDLVSKLRTIQRKLVFKGEELRKIFKDDKQKQLKLSIDFEELGNAINADEQIELIDCDVTASFGGVKALSHVRWCCIQKLCSFCMEYAGTIRKYFQDNDMYDYILKCDEIELLSGFNDLLEIFTTFTQIIQGDKYPTINYHAIFYTTIEDKLLSVMVLHSNVVITKAAYILYEHLEKRMGLFPESIAAAIIDPMFQNLPIIDKWIENHPKFESRVDVIEAVINDFDIRFDDNRASDSTPVHVVENSNLILSLVQKYTASNANGSVSSDLKSELQRFRTIQNHPNDLMKFWKENRGSFPKLSVVGETILGIPLSTAKAESAFSISGCLISSKRSSLAPERSERILFVHDNYDLINI